MELEDISLEQLLELENIVRVLSYSEFYLTKNNIKYQLLALLVYLTKDKFLNPSIILNNDYNIYRKNLPIYKKIETLYHKLLDDLVLEIMSSSVKKDPLSLSILLGNYLIPSGLLSYTNTFYPTNSKSLFSCENQYEYNTHINGAYIVAGYGCCRHITSFVSDVFHKMKITNDKITCIHAKKEEIFFNVPEQLKANHLILGYEANQKYYLADIFNQIYYLPINDKYIETGCIEKIILDYTKTNLFQSILNWNPNLKYATYTQEEINERKYKIAMALHLGEFKRFERFKQEHFELYQKLAYLVPLELERTRKKENQKIKRI